MFNIRSTFNCPDFIIRFEDILTMEMEVEYVILQEELLELSNDEELKVTIKRRYLRLRTEMPEKCPELWGTAKKLLVSFAKSYAAEESFSVNAKITHKEKVAD
nr:unnamed protein product [Callosobruchus analis]